MVLSATVVSAAMKAGRKALEDYSYFDSAMVTDAALNTFVVDILTAAYAVSPPASHVSTPHKAQS